MRSFVVAALLAAGLGVVAQTAQAQEGGQPVRPTPTTQYVMQNGAVVQRQGRQITPLAKNIRLPNGTKVNVKSGIVEYPGGQKITTLHEGDYVKADGGVVFATPASAAASRGELNVPANAQYTTYVQTGAASPNASQEIKLLRQKVTLLTRKVSAMQSNASTADLDAQLTDVDQQLGELAKPKK